MNDNTACLNACCLNRFACELGGKPRNLEAMPCGFEMCASVEACPKARRMQGEVDPPRLAID